MQWRDYTRLCVRLHIQVGWSRDLIGKQTAGFLAREHEVNGAVELLAVRSKPRLMSAREKRQHAQARHAGLPRHGGWIPISAGILKGRRVTGSLGIKDDLENAGGVWVNEPVVVDRNLISSRTPRDLAPFARAMVEFLEGCG